MKNLILPFPPRGCTSFEQLNFYKNLIEKDYLNITQLKLCKERVNRIDNYFSYDAISLQRELLKTITEMIGILKRNDYIEAIKCDTEQDETIVKDKEKLKNEKQF